MLCLSFVLMRCFFFFFFFAHTYHKPELVFCYGISV
ncbi:C4-dicarboxylate ABC transporter, partial [Vibrio cholerae]